MPAIRFFEVAREERVQDHAKLINAPLHSTHILYLILLVVLVVDKRVTNIFETYGTTYRAVALSLLILLAAPRRDVIVHQLHNSHRVYVFRLFQIADVL